MCTKKPPVCHYNGQLWQGGQPSDAHSHHREVCGNLATAVGGLTLISTAGSRPLPYLSLLSSAQALK